jgi:hypothetical protein
MKNDFCELSHQEIRVLKVTDNVSGFLLSPFQFNEQNGYILVPKEAFKEAIDIITAYAIAVDSGLVVEVSQ